MTRWDTAAMSLGVMSPRGDGNMTQPERIKCILAGYQERVQAAIAIGETGRWDAEQMACLYAQASLIDDIVENIAREMSSQGDGEGIR